jgi:transposase
LITDANGVVLKVEVTPANVPDQSMLLPMLKDLPKVPTVKSRVKIKEIMGDRAYGTKAVIAGVQAMGMESMLAERSDETHGSGLGELRYVVEQSLSHFGMFRRLKICYERTKVAFQAFHDLASSLLVVNKIRLYEPQF